MILSDTGEFKFNPDSSMALKLYISGHAAKMPKQPRQRFDQKGNIRLNIKVPKHSTMALYSLF